MYEQYVCMYETYVCMLECMHIFSFCVCHEGLSEQNRKRKKMRRKKEFFFASQGPHGAAPHISGRVEEWKSGRVEETLPEICPATRM
jgi:hypothetical protein